MKLAYLFIVGNLCKAFVESTEASDQMGDAEKSKKIEHRFLSLGFFPSDERQSASASATHKPLTTYKLFHHSEKSFGTNLGDNWAKGKGKGVAPKKQSLRMKTTKTTNELTLDKKLWQRDSDIDKHNGLMQNEGYQPEALENRGGDYWKQMKWKMHWKGRQMDTTKAPDGKRYVKGKGGASQSTWSMWKVKSMQVKSKKWSSKGKSRMWKVNFKGKGNVWKGKPEPDPVGVWFRESALNATERPRTLPPSIINATDNPTTSPVTSRPTRAPTRVPTRAPIVSTSIPTRSPISVPSTPQPTTTPTSTPTAAPVPLPVVPQPTVSPTFSPTVVPVSVPTEPDQTSSPSEDTPSEFPRYVDRSDLVSFFSKQILYFTWFSLSILPAACFHLYFLPRPPQVLLLRRMGPMVHKILTLALRIRSK